MHKDMQQLTFVSSFCCATLLTRPSTDAFIVIVLAPLNATATLRKAKHSK